MHQTLTIVNHESKAHNYVECISVVNNHYTSLFGLYHVPRATLRE